MLLCGFVKRTLTIDFSTVSEDNTLTFAFTLLQELSTFNIRSIKLLERDYNRAQVLGYTNYYLGGMTMPGRSYLSNNYRYGFQGQEKNAELSGTYDFKYRVSDPRIIRFFSTDPLEAAYPYNSTYAFSENDFVSSIELEGAEKLKLFYANGKWSADMQNGIDRSVTTKQPNTEEIANIAKSKVNAMNHAIMSTQHYISEGHSEQNTPKFWRDRNTKLTELRKIEESYKTIPLIGGALSAIPASSQEQILSGDFSYIRSAKNLTLPAIDFSLTVATFGEAAAIKSEIVMAYRSSVYANRASTLLKATVLQYQKAGLNPATVSVAYLLNGSMIAGQSGPYIVPVLPEVKAAFEKLGGMGTIRFGNTIGCCSEQRNAVKLLNLPQNSHYGLSDVTFTEAVRPSTEKIINKCQNCLDIFK